MRPRQQGGLLSGAVSLSSGRGLGLGHGDNRLSVCLTCVFAYFLLSQLPLCLLFCFVLIIILNILYIIVRSYMCDSKLHGIENIWPDFDSSVSNLKSYAANRELAISLIAYTLLLIW